MPPILGMRGTEQLAPDQRKIDMSKAIKMLVPDETPFTTFLQSLSKVRYGLPRVQGARGRRPASLRLHHHHGHRYHARGGRHDQVRAQRRHHRHAHG